MIQWHAEVTTERYSSIQRRGEHDFFQVITEVPEIISELVLEYISTAGVHFLVVQLYRSTEVQKYRSTEVQKYRSTEVQ